MSCQLKYLGNIKQKNPWFNYMRWHLNRLLGGLYKNLALRKLTPANNTNKNAFRVYPIHIDQIEVGDLIKVRSRDEIKITLDSLNKTKGCKFKTEMYDDCEKEFTVYHRVDYFFDEAKQKICKCNNIYLLEGSHCYQCDRHCFIFWHAGWLKKA